MVRLFMLAAYIAQLPIVKQAANRSSSAPTNRSGHSPGPRTPGRTIRRMESLPMAPDSCTLDQHQLSEQLGRYRTVGAGATVIESTATRCVIRVADSVAEHLVDELITA